MELASLPEAHHSSSAVDGILNVELVAGCGVSHVDVSGAPIDVVSVLSVRVVLLIVVHVSVHDVAGVDVGRCSSSSHTF